jgi:hypothetical protein
MAAFEALGGVPTEILYDRLLHHAVVVQIEGSRHWLRQHADLVPEILRIKAGPSPCLPPDDAAGHRKRAYQIRSAADHRIKLDEFYFRAFEENLGRIDSLRRSLPGCAVWQWA